MRVALINIFAVMCGAYSRVALNGVWRLQRVAFINIFAVIRGALSSAALTDGSAY